MNAALSRPRPLSVRRRVVLVSAGGYLLAVLAAQLRQVSALPNWLWGPLLLLGEFLAFAGAMQLTLPRRLGLPHLKAPDLDERQRQRLSQAFVTAYRILAVVLLLGSLYGAAALWDRGLPVPGDLVVWTLLRLGTVLLAGSLPSAVLAWTEPDMSE